MKRGEWLRGYAVSGIVFLALDASWLATTADRLYRPRLGHLMAPHFSWVPGALFYALYFAGIAGFAIAPALAARRPGVALARGAALGLLAYATYDLTNQATLRDWPLVVTVADLAWGTFATGATGFVATVLLLRRRSPESS